MYPHRTFLFDGPDKHTGRHAPFSIRLAESSVRLIAVLTLFVAGSSLTCPARGQSSNSGRVNREAERTDILSNEPRPMKATVVALAEELGWTVDYEDPPYKKDSPSVSDLTNPTWRTTHPNELFVGLRGGSFVTHLTPAESASTSTPTGTLERIVKEYNQSSLPGRFSVRTGEEGRFAVVGVATRDSSGAYKQSPVIFDTPLHLTSARTDLYDALSIITAELTQVSSHQVVVGTVPLNLLSQAQCVLTSEKISSRAAVGRVLDSAPIKLAYSLLYDPNDDLYVLNVEVVTRTAKTAHGAIERSVVPVESH